MEHRIDEVLTDLVDNWVDFLHNGTEGDGIKALEEAKSQISELIREAENKARIDELKKFAYNTSKMAGDLQLINNRIDRLTKLKEEQLGETKK